LLRLLRSASQFIITSPETAVVIQLLTLVGTLLVAVVVLTITAIALVRRNRDRLRGSGSLGNAMQELEGLFVESKQHVLKVERADDAEEEATSGDPPIK